MTPLSDSQIEKHLAVLSGWAREGNEGGLTMKDIEAAQSFEQAAG